MRRELQRKGGSYREGCVAPGLVLGPAWWRQKFGIRGAEASRGSVVVKQVSEVGGGLVMEGSVSEEEYFEVICRGTGSQWRFWRTGVMWSWKRVSGRAAEF